MTKEHDKLQDKDDSCHLDPSSKRVAWRSKSFLIFCIVAVFVFAIIFWGIKTFLPPASESTSGSKPTFIIENTSKREATDLLKKEMLEIANRLVAEFPSNERTRVLVVEAHRLCLNYTQVEALLEEGVRLNPGYGDFYQKIANISSFQGEHDKAITFWKKTLEISPENLDLNVDIAGALMSLGKYREATDILQKHIKTSPRSALSYYLLGQGYLQLKEYDLSKKYFEKAIELRPNHPQANYGLATVYMRLKQPDKAREHMEIHRKWRANKTSYRKTKAGGDQIGTISDSVGKEFPLFSKYLAKLCLHGSGLYRVNKNLEEAEKLLRKGEKAFKRAIEIAPKQPEVYRDLSYMYIVTGRNLTEASQLAEKAVELKGSAENFFALFRVYSRNNDPGKALKALDKAIELDPDNLQYRQTYDKITKGRI